MGMWPIARVNKPESDNPSSLESVELATDSSGPSEEPIRRSIVHFAWERGHLRRNPAMSLVMTLGVVLAVLPWHDRRFRACTHKIAISGTA
jgi:hypothetical protein